MIDGPVNRIKSFATVRGREGRGREGKREGRGEGGEGRGREGRYLHRDSAK